LTPSILAHSSLQIELISKNNYTSESHVIETPDGYLLTLHRITGNRQSSVDKKKPIVFLMHCFIASSSIWVMYGPKRSLAYKLVDAGYDVWLGNARGNVYSRTHTTLDPDHSPEYWNFSWHEIGTIDLPAMIDFILEKTGNEKLQYIGYSMVSAWRNVISKLMSSELS
jgi:lysosomal acid lipase/cholesteryl ester hydrolase